MSTRQALYFLPTLILLLMSLSGCDQWLTREHHDPTMKLKRRDYDTLIAHPPQKIPEKPHVTPRATAIQSQPPPVFIPQALRKTVSLSVADSLPVRAIFTELARQSGASISIDPNVSATTSGVFYTAKHKPMIDVVRHLSKLFHLRYEINDGVLMIEADKPFVKTYNLHYLNFRRQTNSRISISTDVFSGNSLSNVGDNGSDSVLTGTAQADFWVEFEHNLRMILLSTGSKEIGREVRIQAQSSASLDAASTTIKSVEVKKEPDSLMPYTMHKQAGLVTVYGTEHQHKMVEAYLEKLKNATATQVMIEAKIVEVTLSDDFKSGINWNLVNNALAIQAPIGGLSTPGAFDGKVTPPKDVFTFATKKNNLSGVARLMQKFGTVRTLSNPRLTVMNNQSAMLKVAENRVFFKLDFDRTYGREGNPDSDNSTSTVQTVPIGLVLTVHPSVNKETGLINMTLRPTISRVVGTVNDPAVAIKSNQAVTSEIPIVQVREMDTVIQMKSGQVVIMGGLMEERVKNEVSGIPGIDEVPLLGALTSGRDDARVMTELVIFLRAYIVDDQFVASTTTPADERLYKDFVRDPRPLEF